MNNFNKITFSAGLIALSFSTSLVAADCATLGGAISNGVATQAYAQCEDSALSTVENRTGIRQLPSGSNISLSGSRKFTVNFDCNTSSSGCRVDGGSSPQTSVSLANFFSDIRTADVSIICNFYVNPANVSNPANDISQTANSIRVLSLNRYINTTGAINTDHPEKIDTAPDRTTAITSISAHGSYTHATTADQMMYWNEPATASLAQFSLPTSTSVDYTATCVVTANNIVYTS